MVPIGPKKRPLLEYVVGLLVFHKIRDITMLTGYRADEVEKYFDNGSRFGTRINYSRIRDMHWEVLAHLRTRFLTVSCRHSTM